MELPLERIQDLVTACDPQKPLLGGSPLYIPLDRNPPVRGDRACVDLMERTILTSRDSSCQLFTGFPGTGKSTELRQLEHRMSEAQAPRDAFVLFVNFGEFIQRYQPISTSDVLRVLAYCVSAKADQLETRTCPPGESYLRKLLKLVQHSSAKAELKSMSFEALGAKLMLEIRNNPSIYNKIETAIRSRFQSFVDETREVIVDGIKRIQKVIGGRAKRFVIIADGLEKLDALVPEERGSIEASVESLFVANGEFLKLPCHVIYTFPVWLRFRNAQLGAIYDCEPLTLPMVKVHDRQDKAFEPGLDKLYKLISKRLDVPSEIFGKDPERTLRPLLQASGGYPRDALRIVRTLLQREVEYPITPVAIDREIRNLKKHYHDTVLGQYANLLRHVRRTHQLPNDTEQQLRLFGQLFSRFLVLAYRNGEEWFDLHPLVRDAPALASAPAQITSPAELAKAT